MAISEHGDGKYEFSWGNTDAAALETLLGVAPMTLSESGAAEFIAKAEDTTGHVAAMAVGDDGKTFTLSGYLTDATKFEDAVSFTYEGDYFIITGRKRDTASKEYKKCEFTGESYSKITGPVV
jgi:hypothetical protein